ncbi:MAG: SpoIIE family protein phosphatase [Phycisphaerae bacterium]|nr:SpoIIE family protein phosphatase [Phycisphaerae bacterium]
MSLPDIQEQLSDLKGVLAVARELGATTDLRTMLSRIQEAARSVMEADRASVFLYDAATDDLYSYVATGVNEIRFSATRGLAGAAVQARHAVNVPDAYADERFNRDVDQQTGYRTRNVLTLPLVGLDDKIVGVLQILNKKTGTFAEWDEQLGETLAAQAGAAIQRQMLLDEYAEKRKLEHDLDVARTIQQELIPSEPPRVTGFDIAGWNKPADRTGGDAFDFMRLDGERLAITIADATGHGIGPALVIAECRALLRATASTCDDPVEIITRVNDLLVEDLPGDRFVTCFFGLLDPDRASLRYCSGGQAPLFHFRAADDSVTELQASGMPLGLVPRMTCDRTDPINFEPGDMLVLVTDGFFEWMAASGEQFGTGRLVDLIRRHKDQPAADLIQTMYREVVRFGAGTEQADDLTAIVIKKTNGPADGSRTTD